MGKTTKIDWCDSTWNPVTGCLHGCEYCYARRIAERFGSNQMPIFTDYPVLNEPVRCTYTYDYMRESGINAGKRKRWAWVVIGAETGNSKNKVAPKREWIDDIATACADYGTPVFMKESLRELMGDDFKQEFPWEV